MEIVLSTEVTGCTRKYQHGQLSCLLLDSLAPYDKRSFVLGQQSLFHGIGDGSDQHRVFMTRASVIKTKGMFIGMHNDIHGDDDRRRRILHAMLHISTVWLLRMRNVHECTAVEQLTHACFSVQDKPG